MKIESVFPRLWLYAEDLHGKAVTVTITGAAMVDVHNPMTKKVEQRLAVSFAKATKRLIINKTQARAIVQITGCDDTDDWAGKRVTLSAATAPNGKQTILVTPVAVQETAPEEAAPPPADETEEDGAE